jgi:hypothetical protein
MYYVCEAANDAGCLGYLRYWIILSQGVQGAPPAPGILG